MLLTADNWKDYEILDAGAGMKLERWAQFTLVRPDPQVLWPRRSARAFSGFDACYHRSADGGGEWEFKKKLPQAWHVSYRDLRFKVHPTDFKHTGLFPEQAVHWDWMREAVKKAGRPVRALNLFGYTGAATIALAKAGAQVTHVDSAKGMVNWCRENAELNGLGDASIRYLVDDCVKFAQREIRRESRYDLIVMDPPSFGRGKSGETWKLEKHLWPLMADCAKILSDQPLAWLVNSYTAGLSPQVIQNLLISALGKSGGVDCGETCLPIKTGGLLPCGVFGRFLA